METSYGAPFLCILGSDHFIDMENLPTLFNSLTMIFSVHAFFHSIF